MSCSRPIRLAEISNTGYEPYTSQVLLVIADPYTWLHLAGISNYEQDLSADTQLEMNEPYLICRSGPGRLGLRGFLCICYANNAIDNDKYCAFAIIMIIVRPYDNRYMIYIRVQG